MKALTIHPWWAAAIVRGLKPTENRSWRPNLQPGDRLLVHAGVRRASAEDRRRLRVQLLAAGVPDLDLLTAPTGRIVGSVTYLGCDTDQRTPWDIPGCWHWRLGDAQEVLGAVLPGRLGLWTPNASAAA